METGAGPNISPLDARIGYIDGDSFPDLVVASSLSNGDVATPRLLTVLRGDGTGNLRQPLGPFAGGGGITVNLLDVNSDSREDVVGGWLVVFRPETGTFDAGPVTVDRAAPGPGAWGWGDINNDGIADYVKLYQGASEAHLGLGEGQFSEAIRGASEWTIAVLIRDIDGDGARDLIGLTLERYDRFENAVVHVARGDGAGAFEVLDAPLEVPEGIMDLQTGDFDCDGRADIVMSKPDGVVDVRLRAESGWEPGYEIALDDRTVWPTIGAIRTAVGDFNGDGIQDIAVTTHVFSAVGVDGGSLAILPGDGSGGFGAPQRLGDVQTPTHAEIVVAGDLNGDGIDDIVVVDPRVERYVTVWVSE